MPIQGKETTTMETESNSVVDPTPAVEKKGVEPPMKSTASDINPHTQLPAPTTDASTSNSSSPKYSRDPSFVTESTALLQNSTENKSVEEINTSVDIMDENLDQALGHAADSIWNFASAVTGTVTSVVKEGQPGLENFRKKVTSRLAPLDTLGRDLSSQLGALAPNDASFAKISGSVKSVAESVQRNAEAMEAAILASANDAERDHYVRADKNGDVLTQGANSEVAMSDPAVGLLAFDVQKGIQGEGEEEIDVNEEIAKVGETIQSSGRLIGETVGGLWAGLWGQEGNGDQQVSQEVALANMTRFEKRIYELQANPDTYCEPAKDLDAFAEWSKSFNLDDNADGCISILDAHDSIAELYERVVPRIVDEDTFWMRYFFARFVLEKEEDRRKKILEQAEHTVTEGNEEDNGWDDDDWDDDNDENAEQPQEGIADAPLESSGESSVGNADASGKNGLEGRETEKKTAASNLAPVPSTVEKFGSGNKEDDWDDDDWE